MSKTIDMYSVIQNEETSVLHTECPTGILNSEEPIPHATECPTGILYNTCYGGFGFSKQCVDEYKKRTGNVIAFHQAYRKDPVMIQLFLEKGSEWMSNVHAELAFYKVPNTLLPYVKIDEYDGKETVHISKQEIYAVLLLMFRNSVKEDLSNLQEEYRNMCSKLQEFQNLFKDIPNPTWKQRIQSLESI